MKEIYFAAGCFWGAQKYLKLIRGVVETEVGYANGHTPSPTYKQVYTDTTGFAEAVCVRYDTELTSLERLVRLYFKAVDPLSLNKQGEDVGTRYRTGVYYTDAEDLPVIRKIFDDVASEYGCALAVELLPLEHFYPAEEMHQDYLDKNPGGYCHISDDLFTFAQEAE